MAYTTQLTRNTRRLLRLSMLWALLLYLAVDVWTSHSTAAAQEASWWLWWPSPSASFAAHANSPPREPRVWHFANALPLTQPLPPAHPAEPWQTLNESLLPYPIFHAATAVLDNAVVLLGGCLTANCATPVGPATAEAGTRHDDDPAEFVNAAITTTTTDSPYHEHSVALEVTTGTITPLPRLTLPPGLGFAGRYAAVTLTDSVYVTRSCTITTLSPTDIAALSNESLQALQAAYAPVVALYPEDKKKWRTRADPAAPAVNISYFEVPLDRVRVNASCTALATENKILIVGGFLLSSQRVTASVDAFNVVTRKYEAEVGYLSLPVLQPSVAASTGFAAVAGGWTFPTTVDDNGGASPSPVPSQPAVEYLFDLLFFEGDRLNPRWRGLNTAAATSSALCLSPVDASFLPRDVVQHILLSELGCHIDIFGGRVVLADHNLDHLAVLDLRVSSLQTTATITRDVIARALYTPTPPNPSQLPRKLRQHISFRSAHPRVPTVSPLALSDDVRSVTSLRSGEKGTTREEEGGQASSRASPAAAAAAASLSSSSTPSPPPPTTAPTTPPPPEPVYHYRWEQPILITLPMSRAAAAAATAATVRARTSTRHAIAAFEGTVHVAATTAAATSTTTTTASAKPTSTPAPDVTPATDTILVVMALGGEDVWTQEVLPGSAREASATVTERVTTALPRRLSSHGASSRGAPLQPAGEVVVRRTAAQRWALRYLPDSTYDVHRDDLLAVKLPTPVWPPELTLQTTVEGTIHLDFPNVNYTRYCSWVEAAGVIHSKKENTEKKDEEEVVVCAVRLSSRRDCVGNAAGTLDTPYNGAPNASLLFSASGGSTTAVYVCFGYVVQPTAWPVCHTQRTFSVLNPMMPLRILDNPPTAPPTTTPTRDPSDRTTSSPLFIFAVGISVVTLMVAVLLVARLQHVPEEGLLVDDLFARSHARSSVRTGGVGGGDGTDLGHYRRAAVRDADADRGGCEADESPAPNSTENDGGPPCPLTSRDDFLHLVASVAGASESRMLDAAADVLRLHQHRYRVLSRVGQGEHSLCFLALRKPPSASPSSLVLNSDGARNVGVGRRGVTGAAISSSPFTGTSDGPPSTCHSTSSLWATRYDQRAAVVVKYTQCPDDTTRAGITRLCERLRDLQTSGGSSVRGLGDTSSHLHSSSSSSGARDAQPCHLPPQPQHNHRRTPPPSEVTSRAVSGASATSASRGIAAAVADKATEQLSETAVVNSHTGAVNVWDEEGETGNEGDCAWLDAHEVDIVLSLFLLLPADLFVSYEVSMLQQQQQQQLQLQHGLPALSRHSGGGDRLIPNLHHIAAQWNRQFTYTGRTDHTKKKRSTRTTLRAVVQQVGRDLRDSLATAVMTDTAAAADRRDRSTREATITQPSSPMLPQRERIFVASLTADSPRVCWDACVNALQPATASPWSLCLVMPYERGGDLTYYALHSRQLLPADAWKLPGYWGCCCCENLLGKCSAADSWAISLPAAKHCWTESLLCSLLFQIGGALQLLHQQSPPILHGDLKGTNVLLRAPAVLSVARRRVCDLNSSRGGGKDGDKLRAGVDPLAIPGADGPPLRLRPPHLLWKDGTVIRNNNGHTTSPSVAAALPLSEKTFKAPSSTTGRPDFSSSLLPPPAEWYLSTKTYLPVSLTDSGMSWWLSVQLPQRLRGCFGFTTQSTLQQTPAGRCWLHRYHAAPRPGNAAAPCVVSAAPSEAAIASLAHFLYVYVEVPSHVAPELLWGQLCHLSSTGAVAIENSSGGGRRGELGGINLQQQPRQRTGGYPCQRNRPVAAVDTQRASAGTPSISSNENNSAQTNEASNDLDDDLMLKSSFVGDAGQDGDQGGADNEESGEAAEENDTSCDDVDVDAAEEEGVFTSDEVALLTSTMWKAEGLTRVSRQQRGHGSVDGTSATGGGGMAAGRFVGGGMPASLSDGLPVAAATAPPLPHLTASPFSPPPHTAFTPARSPQGYRVNGSGGGSHSVSSVYEVLIQRVLAMDTASDVWSLGLLLYEMCTDAPRCEYATREDEDVTTVGRRSDSACSAVTSASALAQRAFAALLGDLYALAHRTSLVSTVHPSLPAHGVGSTAAATETASKSSTAAAADENAEEAEADLYDEDRECWPRSCAVENEVAGAFITAGYSSSLARLLSRALSPVAARRPTAAEVVNQVRLVVPNDSSANATAAAASSNISSSSPVMAASLGPRRRRTLDVTVGSHGVNAAAEGEDGDSARVAAAVVLNERTALMKLRTRHWLCK